MEGSTYSINLSCGNIIVISHQTFQRGIWIWISQEPQRTMLMLKLLDTYMMSASSSDGKWEIILSKHEWQLVGRERERERGEQIRISRAGGLDQLSWGERCANISSDGLHSSGELRLRLRLEMEGRCTPPHSSWLYSGHCRHQPSWRPGSHTERYRRDIKYFSKLFFRFFRNEMLSPIKDRQRRQLAALLRNNPIWALLIRASTL